jgi:hypothetical protein
MEKIKEIHREFCDIKNEGGSIVENLRSHPIFRDRDCFVECLSHYQDSPQGQGGEFRHWEAYTMNRERKLSIDENGVFHADFGAEGSEVFAFEVLSALFECGIAPEELTIVLISGIKFPGFSALMAIYLRYEEVREQESCNPLKSWKFSKNNEN